MTLYEDLLENLYLDPTYTMVSNLPHTNGNAPNCDNYFLFTAEDMVLSGWIGCRKLYDAALITPGLFHRYPGRTDDISQDELIGASILDQFAAYDILRYGRSHFWCFNAEHPGKFKWRFFCARFPHFIPIIKKCATFELSLIDKIMWSIGCVLSPNGTKSDTSGKLLMWVQIDKMKNSYWLTDIAIKIWKKRMTNKYSGGLKELMTIYFGENHPFSKHSPETF